MQKYTPNKTNNDCKKNFQKALSKYLERAFWKIFFAVTINLRGQMVAHRTPATR